jgi:hypothetical protein
MHHRALAIGVALLAALAPDLLVAWSLSRELPRFYNPCLEWGSPSHGYSTSGQARRIPSGAPCRVFERTTDTKTAAVLRLLIVQGGILIGTLLGVLGALRALPSMSVLGSGLLFLEAVPLIFSFAWLMVLASGLFLLVARLIAPLRRITYFGQRVIGSVAGIALLVYLSTMLVHKTIALPLFFLFLLIALAFVTVVAWWPVRNVTAEPTS